jgi:hypothetical protein
MTHRMLNTFNVRHDSLRSYKESAHLRVQIADDLSNLPLSYFSKHNLSDLSQLPTKSITEIKGKNRAIPPDLGIAWLIACSIPSTSHLRVQIADDLSNLPLSYFSKHNLSDLSQTIMSDVEGKNRAIPPDLGIAWLIACSIPSTSDMIVWDKSDNLYNSTYKESAHLRVQIADDLSNLPLSYFSKHNLSDFACSIPSTSDMIVWDKSDKLCFEK